MSVQGGLPSGGSQAAATTGMHAAASNTIRRFIPTPPAEPDEPSEVGRPRPGSHSGGAAGPRLATNGAVSGVDDLFALDPSEFTAARDRLVAELREAGDKGAAAEVKALRRPTVTAWALNQLARRH